MRGAAPIARSARSTNPVSAIDSKKLGRGPRVATLRTDLRTRGATLSLFAELNRRNVLRVGLAYLALGWLVTQVTTTVAPMLHLPDWVGPVVLWIGIIGLPFVVMFAWVYVLTPEGLK